MNLFISKNKKVCHTFYKTNLKQTFLDKRLLDARTQILKIGQTIIGL